MQIKTVAVVGPGGSVGRPVIQLLLEDGSFDVTAAIRPTSKYTAPDGVKAVTADFGDHDSLVKALKGQDALVCCVPGGQTQFKDQKILIDAAIAAGVKLYFASEYSGDIHSKMFALNPTAFVGEKVRVRAYLEEVAAAGKISWTALNPGAFFDMWLHGTYAGFDVPKRTAKIYDSGNATLCWTPVPTVMRTVVNMLRNPDPVLNRAISIAGVCGLNQNALLAALEAETGEKFAVEHAETEPLFEAAKVALEKGEMFQAVLGLGMNTMFSDKRSVSNVWDRVENELVGVEPVSVREAVQIALAGGKAA